MIINHNLMAMNAHRNLKNNSTAQAKSLEKLSSGYRINRAGDDAAGLSISEKMRAQIRGLDQASRNSQDGISMIQTAEGALNEVHSILQRMRELAVQSANDTNATADRTSLESEVTQLNAELTRIQTNTGFNTKNLLDGSAGLVNIQVGANSGQVMVLSFDATGINLSAVISYAASISFSTTSTSQSSITLVDDALSLVSKGRSLLGAYQNRLEHTINNLDNASENLQSSESRIRDVDMAKEMMEYSKQNILNQAATAMLAQANQVPQGVLQLLR